jgi:transcriptional regulator with XRE-family HTH domain
MLQISRVSSSRSVLVRSLATRGIPASEVDPKRLQTKVRTKLNYFLETGEILQQVPKANKWYDGRSRSGSRNIASKSNVKKPSLDKIFIIFKKKYDAHKFFRKDGKEWDLEQIKPSDFRTDSKKSLQIFKNLIEFKKITKQSIPIPVIHTLLGITLDQLKDEFVVTKSTVNLLMRDNSTERAEYLARLAGNNGTVAMNAILQWLLERGEIKLAFKHINDRKKWNIPPNAQTYVIFFDGVARAHEWGKISKDTSAKCIDIFEQQHEIYSKALKSAEKGKVGVPRVNIEHFNSCLNVLVKNYDNDQLMAWEFFDKIVPQPNSNSNLYKIIPDCHTFTILLNGVRKYAISNAEKVTADRNMPLSQKTIKLLEIQAKLVQSAEMVLTKVMNAATPPTPPTKEAVDENPAVLIDYRAKMRRQLLDIDPAFVSVFTSCFINNIGTGTDIKLGSHYKYVEQGLKYMKVWSPSVGKLYDFLLVLNNGTDVTQATKSVKFNNDLRISKAVQDVGDKLSLEASSVQEVMPANVITHDVTMDKYNPKVIFPPPPLSKNKTRAIFSGKAKPLVDFCRPTYAEVRALVLDKQYHDSRGKYGTKLPANSSASLNYKPDQINRFLLQHILDGLLKQGRNNEFIMAIWYILTQYGNIRLSARNSSQEKFGAVDVKQLEEMIKGKDISQNFLPEINYTALQSSYEKITQKINKKTDSIDIQLVHSMFYKLNENFRKHGQSAIKVIGELYTCLVNPRTNSGTYIQPTDTTIDIIFSSLMTDLHYYNDFNYNGLVKSKKKNNIPNNSPRKSISHEQLLTILPVLSQFIIDIISYQATYRNPNVFINVHSIESYNKFVERLYKTTWLDVNEELKTNHHKEIMKSGILFYCHRQLIAPEDSTKYSSVIVPSIEYVYNDLKTKEHLTTEDNNLMRNLRILLQIKDRDQFNKQRWLSLTKSIHSCL